MAPARKRSARRRKLQLSKLTDDQLLNLRFCDLPIKVQGSPVVGRIKKLFKELDDKGIRYRPHYWLSNEWFSPDHIPGIAVPFYLAHPRLIALEQRQMLEVEGLNEAECMRILRHEAGHAIDTAFKLRYQKGYKRVFGPHSKKYPDTYTPRPGSRDYVIHLKAWYAQAHPTEDFAETFAVWLTPGSSWRKRYQDWGALKKLEYVDEVMTSLTGKRPKINSRATFEPLSSLKQTLREHYRIRHQRYSKRRVDIFDRDLLKIFSAASYYSRRESAASFLRRIKPELRRIIADWTHTSLYTIDHVLSEMIDRCQELRLHLTMTEKQIKQHVLVMMSVQTMNYMLSGNLRVAL
ncbi:MAG: hypothetical protein DCC75_00360 [Proteobacteria bacterium]|nr:MAG: hypothetical protein DCC75_00360 [Pseudomonadota bacterium]